MTWPIDPSRYDVDAPVTEDLLKDIIDQIATNTAGLSANSNASNCPPIPNGSFEVDANLQLTPTGWAVSVLSGGAGIVTNSDSFHGANSYRATHPGGASNGGAILTTVDYMPVSIGQAFDLFYALKTTITNVRIKIIAYWYDSAQSQIGLPITVVDTTGIPTTWTQYVASVTPATTPAAAKFLKLQFVLGDTSVDPGALAYIYIDGITMASRRVFSMMGSITTSSNWTVPAGVTLIKVECVGGGAGGSSTGGGGGGGGYNVRYYQVQPGQVIWGQVGTGGGVGSNGGNTQCLSQIAHGGQSFAGGGAAGGFVNTSGISSRSGEPGKSAGPWGVYGTGGKAGSGGNGGIIVITY